MLKKSGRVESVGAGIGSLFLGGGLNVSSVAVVAHMTFPIPVGCIVLVSSHRKEHKITGGLTIIQIIWRRSPGCTAHRCEAPCSPMRSERSCLLRRTGDAPGAARGRDGKPARTHTHARIRSW